VNRPAAAAIAAAVAGGLACGDFGDTSRVGAPRPAIRFATEIQPIFTTNCAVSNCHAPQINESLDLRAGNAYDQIVGVPSVQNPALQRIHPGLPDSSYLLLKLTDCACYAGLRMPQFGPALSAAEQQLLRDWVAAGAPR
jgi:hypothetical protein